MLEFTTGVVIFVFGLAISGVDLTTGNGIVIPLIPLGLYLVVRGVRTISYRGAYVGNKALYRPKVPRIPHSFELTKWGGVCFGLLVILIGAATPALVVGIPIIILGVGLISYNLFMRRRVRSR